MTVEEFSPEDLEDLDPEISEADKKAEFAETLRLAEGERLAAVYLQSAKELLQTAKLEPDWLVPNAIPAGAVSFFVGRPGAAKSWLAYDLACAVVQQRPFLDFGVPTAGPRPSAFILNYDNPQAEAARRFLRLGLREEDELYVHSFGAHQPPESYPSVLQLPDAFDPLEAMAYSKRPAVIVIDSLRQAHTGDESSSQEMARVIGQVKRLAMLGAAVIVVHHTRKNDGAMRGSTEIEASADSITDVEKENEEVSLISWRKTRGWQMIEPTLSIRLVDEGDRTYVRGGLSLSSLLTQDGPLGRAEIAKALSLRQEAAKKLIDRALEKGLVEEIRNQAGARIIRLLERTPIA